MGMFDSLYDVDGDEWQTKAFGCSLAQYNIGQIIDEHVDGDLTTYQVSVFGEPGCKGFFVDSFATVIDQRLVVVPAERDRALPLIDYGGGIIDRPTIHTVCPQEEQQ